MLKFIVKRLLLGVVVMLGVITITFLLVHVLPSNPAAKWVGARATPEQIAQAEIELGLDKPLPVQYVNYIKDLLNLDMGRSLRTHQPVTKELANYLPATLELVLCATILAVLIGLPMGILSAKNKDKLGDHLSRFISIGAVSLPTFWMGIFMQLIFYSWLYVLPVGGQLSQNIKIFYEIPHVTGFLIFDSIITGNWTIAADALRHMACAFFRGLVLKTRFSFACVVHLERKHPYVPAMLATLFTACIKSDIKSTNSLCEMVFSSFQ